jgi:tetratricopeptide (TPR) repeat protein
MIKILVYTVLLISVSCQGQNPVESKKTKQEIIIEEHVTNCADKINYTISMQEYQNCLDAGIKKDSTIARLWQQKAMPYFKAKKYEVGMPLLNKAVKYDKQRWLAYRGFIKCIFSRNYKDAIIDFEECIKQQGNGYEMDHSYSFYIALSYLQLNEFSKANEIFQKDILAQEKQFGNAHHLDLFYYGITKYEESKWEEAIIEFDKSLKEYPTFSDAQFYKAICLARINKKEEAMQLMEKARNNFKDGYTINEDNAIYETYPYKVKF